jgi:septum formation topological specificity factor MinE
LIKEQRGSTGQTSPARDKIEYLKIMRRSILHVIIDLIIVSPGLSPVLIWTSISPVPSGSMHFHIKAPLEQEYIIPGITKECVILPYLKIMRRSILHVIIDLIIVSPGLSPVLIWTRSPPFVNTISLLKFDTQAR